MSGRDEAFQLSERLSARARSDWEKGVSRTLHQPDEIVELCDYAASVTGLPDEPGRQLLAFTLRSGRQYHVKMQHGRAVEMAELMKEIAADEGPSEPPAEMPE